MNIILQHWSGPKIEVADESFANIRAYARRIGADYCLISGETFRPGLYPAYQKMVMLSAMWDEYEDVCMIDSDMFSRTNESIFNVAGIGMHTGFTDKIFERFKAKHPNHASDYHPFWGGAIWKFTRDQRAMFREFIREEDIAEFDVGGRGNFHEEGLMHRIATLADFRDPSIIPEEWAFSSYMSDVESAKIVHVRRRTGRTGERLDKEVVYERLKECGIL